MAEQAVQLSEHQEGEEEVVEYMGQMGAGSIQHSTRGRNTNPSRASGE
jgi:hypothetical protein